MSFFLSLRMSVDMEGGRVAVIQQLTILSRTTELSPPLKTEDLAQSIQEPKHTSTKAYKELWITKHFRPRGLSLVTRCLP